MVSDEHTIALLRFFFRLRILTRPEVGKMVGATVGRIAGLCRRHGIEPWPEIPPKLKEIRRCCFPLTLPSATKPRLCDKEHSPTCTFLCTEHEHVEWDPKKAASE